MPRLEQIIEIRELVQERVVEVVREIPKIIEVEKIVTLFAEQLQLVEIEKPVITPI